MQKQMICTILWCLTVVLGSCSSKPEESVTEVKNGAFKILVRSQEFHHSAIRNIDICVVPISVSKFPKDETQCFFHGFDFSSLSVTWRSQQEIEIFFRNGRVSYFRNYAFAYPSGPIPVEFHATLCDGCDAGSKDTVTSDTKR